MTHPTGTAPDELLAFVGHERQLADAELLEASDGPERGGRKALIRTLAGLELTVHIDRGFDLGSARYRGVNLTWCSPVGAAHHAQPSGADWLARFPGGLLTTCGFENVGPSDLHRPLHGSASALPARLLSRHGFWADGRYWLELTGEVRDYALFGRHLSRVRSYTLPHDRAVLTVRDVLTNCAGTPAEVVMLYHCNFGYPLVAPGATLRVTGQVTPRDADAAEGETTLREITPPTAGYREQVFFVSPEGHAGELWEVGIDNPALSRGVTLRFSPDTLPHLTLWKQLGRGAYVVGLEPGISHPLGFTCERAAGRYVLLGPGETLTTALDFEFR